MAHASAIRFLLTFFLSYFTLNFAQGIICSGNKPLHYAHGMIVLDDNEYTFSLSNGEEAKWLLTGDFYPAALDKLSKRYTGKSFTVAINEKNLSWGQAIRYEFDGDSSIYYRCNVTAETKSGKRDSLQLLLNLMPSKPKLFDIKLQYDSFDFASRDFVNPVITWKMTIARVSNDVHIKTYYRDYEDNFGFYEICDVNHYAKDLYSASFNLPPYVADLLMAVWVFGEYGDSESNEIFSRDLITDPKIRAALGLGDITAINSDGMGNEVMPNVEINSGKLVVFPHNAQNEYSITMYDAYGRRVVSCKGSEADVSSLKSGIYIVNVFADNKKVIVKKIKI